jgi:hypothetical protein
MWEMAMAEHAHGERFERIMALAGLKTAEQTMHAMRLRRRA